MRETRVWAFGAMMLGVLAALAGCGPVGGPVNSLGGSALEMNDISGEAIR